MTKYSKKLLAVWVIMSALTLLVGCGGSSSTTTTPSSGGVVSTTSSGVPVGAVEVQPGVWAKDGMLYGRDCALLKRLVGEGGAYGPTGSYEDGTAKAGYGTVCFS